MSKYVRFIGFLFTILFAISSYASNVADRDSLLDMLHEEIDTHYTQFRSNNLPTNFIGINVRDVKTFNIESLMGFTIHKNSDSYRQYSVNVKVSTPQSKYFKTQKNGFSFDNSFSFEDRFNGDFYQLQMAISDRLKAVYLGMVKTPKAYKNDRDTISNLKDVSFYSAPTPIRYYEKPLPQSDIDPEEWENILNEICAVFRSSNYQIKASVKLKCDMERRYFVSSDGGEMVSNNQLIVLTMTPQLVNAQGKKCLLEKTYFVKKIEDLPSMSELKEAAKTLTIRLQELYSADRKSVV